MNETGEGYSPENEESQKTDEQLFNEALDLLPKQEKSETGPSVWDAYVREKRSAINEELERRRATGENVTYQSVANELIDINDLDSQASQEIERRKLQNGNLDTNGLNLYQAILSYEPEGAMEKILSERSEVDKEGADYLNIIGQYNGIVDQLENLISRRDVLGLRDDYQDRLLELEQRRHALHLELLELAPKIDKSEVNVRVDLLRSRGNLSEYGLPEISLLKPADFQILDQEERNIKDAVKVGLSPHNLNDSPILKRGEEDRFWDREYDEPPKPGEVMFVYNTSELYLTAWHDRAGLMLQSVFSDAIEARAQRLARDTKLEHHVVYNADYFHSVEDFTRVHGLYVPDDQIERVATIIRENPEKYSPSPKFFSKKELKQAEQLLSDLPKISIHHQIQCVNLEAFEKAYPTIDYFDYKTGKNRTEYDTQMQTVIQYKDRFQRELYYMAMNGWESREHNQYYGGKLKVGGLRGYFELRHQLFDEDVPEDGEFQQVFQEEFDKHWQDYVKPWENTSTAKNLESGRDW